MPAPFTGLANPPIPTDLLLTHAAFLRSLAKSLLGDEHAAEDVVQETWVCALEGPPASQERLGGWLRRVTHGLALKRRRAEGRRAGREQSASRDEGLASVDEALAEQEILRRVVDCVLALEQRYRRVILMRYYQDLPPREIAKRLNLPLATVDSQLHRARELLRRRLDDAAGDRSAWAGALATVTGWKGQAALAAAVSGASAGGSFMVWKIGIGAALAASVWMGVTQQPAAPANARSPGSSPSSESTTQSAALQVAPQSAQAGAQDGAQRGSERVAVDAPPRAEPLPGLPVPAYSFELTATVVDELDRAVPKALILLAPLQQPLNDLGATGRDGTFHATWRASEPQMSVALQVAGPGGGGLYRFDLQAGRTLDVRLGTRTGLLEKRRAETELKLVEMKRREAAGAGGTGAVAEELRARDELKVRVAQGMALGGMLRTPGVSAVPVAGEGFRFSWPMSVPELYVALEGGLYAGGGGIGFGGGAYEVRKKREAANLAEPVEMLRVAGTVVDTNGAPVNDAFVLGDDGHGLHGARTGQEGTFEMQVPLTKLLHLRAGGGDLGLAQTSFDLSEKAEVRELVWDPVLDRGHEVTGRLVDRERQHLDDWMVEAVIADGAALWVDTGESSDPAGAFAIPNVRGSVGQLLVRKNPSSPFANKVVAGVRPGAEQLVVLEPEELGVGSVRVQAVDKAGALVEDAEARLWQASSGRGAWLERKGDALQLAELPRGGYQLSLGTLTRGFVDCGTVWIEPDATTDLGAIALPEAGKLRLRSVSEPRTDQGSCAWQILRADLAATTVVAEGQLADEVEATLPAGQYSLLIRGEELSSPPLAFAVQAGQETALVLDPARLQAVTFVLELPAGVDAPVAWTLVDTGTGAELVTHERAAGAFALYLPEGAYRARASARGLAGAAELVVGSEPLEPVRISLQ